MTTLESIKKRLASFLSILFLAGFLAAGCASVTDATPELDDADETVTETAQDNEESDDPIWHPTNGDDMDPIIERPPHP